ncbi:MAG: VIT1/CCC1 transporter family protein [Thermoplasmata archaeon]|nr:VIT1/CCC1 transporter family protein [Thermoplasmata archaeon]
MDKKEFIALTIKYYKGELKDHYVYDKLSKIEKNPELKESLKNLSKVEKEHSLFFSLLLKSNNIKVEGIRLRKSSIYFSIFLRYILGLSLTLKILERGETEAIKKYMDYLKNSDLDENQRRILKNIINDEIFHEDFFEESEEKIAKRTEKIRDAVYGMSDGLVEVLASVSGLAPVLMKSIFVALGGLVVGISGSLSMAIGAYLSVKAQKDYSNSQVKLERIKSEIKGEEIKKEDESFSNPLSSAINTGLFYIIGAMFPIISFFFIGGIEALILSFILVIIAQSTTSIIISLLSGTPILKSALRTVSLTIIAAVGTYIIGNVIHAILGVSI